MRKRVSRRRRLLRWLALSDLFGLWRTFGFGFPILCFIYLFLHCHSVKFVDEHLHKPVLNGIFSNDEIS